MSWQGAKSLPFCAVRKIEDGPYRPISRRRSPWKSRSTPSLTTTPTSSRRSSSTSRPGSAGGDASVLESHVTFVAGARDIRCESYASRCPTSGGPQLPKNSIMANYARGRSPTKTRYRPATSAVNKQLTASKLCIQPGRAAFNPAHTVNIDLTVCIKFLARSEGLPTTTARRTEAGRAGNGCRSLSSGRSI